MDGEAAIVSPWPERKGIYSKSDARLLVEKVRAINPRFVVEIGGRFGHCTGIIASSLQDADLLVFEMDRGLADGIRADAAQASLPNVRVRVAGNVIDYGLREIGGRAIDLLFIDGNHDSIIARWYLSNLFPLVRVGGLIHVHDVFSTGSDNWSVACRRIAHPDIESPERLRELYPSLVNLPGYCPEELVGRHECHELRDWIVGNPGKVRIESTWTRMPLDGEYPCDCAFWMEVLR